MGRSTTKQAAACPSSAAFRFCCISKELDYSERSGIDNSLDGIILSAAGRAFVACEWHRTAVLTLGCLNVRFCLVASAAFGL